MAVEHISISVILSIIKFIFAPLIKILKWFYSILPFRIVPKKRLPPLGIIESSWRNHMWSYGKLGEKDVIVINTFWQITNTLPYNITAFNVLLTKPVNVKGSFLVKATDSDYYGHYPIPKGYTTDADFNFVIDTKFVKHGENILKVDLMIQDEIGKYHKIKNVIIRPVTLKIDEKKDKLTQEDPTIIKSIILKKVISVLKNEIPQYKHLGRREGRLGTVEWPKGQIEWTKGGEKMRFLFAESRKENVTSEHITALTILYSKSSPPEQKLIRKALLERINKKNEYRDIGYLLAFFFFEIHHLQECLPIFLKKLQGDRANAFSDVLRMLDYLLAFRYDEFSESELDSIEAFVYATKEHPFQIKERINAIRVRNMLKDEKTKN